MRQPGRIPIALLIVCLAAAGCRPESGEAVAEAGAEGAAPEAGATDEREPSFLRRIFQREPETRTLPAGTLVSVRFLDTLSSHDSAPGQSFRATVTQEVAVGGSTVVPAGAEILGSVADAHPPRKIGGRAILSLRFHTLALPSGETYPVSAAFARSGKSEAPKDAAIIGGSTLGGALLGEAVDEGEGTVIGAVVGGIAGALGARRTRGRPVVVPAGTVMTIELTEPVTVTLT